MLDKTLIQDSSHGETQTRFIRTDNGLRIIREVPRERNHAVYFTEKFVEKFKEAGLDFNAKNGLLSVTGSLGEDLKRFFQAFTSKSKSRIDLFVPPVYVNKEAKSTSLYKSSMYSNQALLLDKHRHSVISNFDDEKLKIKFLDKEGKSVVKENKIENNFVGLDNSFELEVDFKKDTFNITFKEPKNEYGELYTAIFNFFATIDMGTNPGQIIPKSSVNYSGSKGFINTKQNHDDPFVTALHKAVTS